MNRAPGGTTARTKGEAARRERLAAELRANLVRRKAQAKARSAQQAGAGDTANSTSAEIPAPERD